ncbi:MAG: arylesterase [Sphingobacteriales bacterium]|nr:arylesterase [Sphingobacteriales bacterium]
MFKKDFFHLLTRNISRLRYLTILFVTVALVSCNNENKSVTENKVKALESSDLKPKEIKSILVFGNSLTAGFGLDDPATEAFPSIIQQKIDSLNLPYKVINGGLSGETSAGGNGRVEWLLKNKVDVFVLELGANDGLRGIPVDQTYKNLQSIITKVKAKYPACKLILTGMMIPPNMGEQYATNFRTIFPKLAKENKMAFVPFLLEGVAGNRKLNQQDGIHPTAEGAKILADNVWKVLEKEL